MCNRNWQQSAAISDDETSEVEVTKVQSKTEKAKPAKKGATVSEAGKKEILVVEDNEEDAEEDAEEEDDEDLDEDEWVSSTMDLYCSNWYIGTS